MPRCRLSRKRRHLPFERRYLTPVADAEPGTAFSRDQAEREQMRDTVTAPAAGVRPRPRPRRRSPAGRDGECRAWASLDAAAAASREAEFPARTSRRREPGTAERKSLLALGWDAA